MPRRLLYLLRRRLESSALPRTDPVWLQLNGELVWAADCAPTKPSLPSSCDDDEPPDTERTVVFDADMPCKAR